MVDGSLYVFSRKAAPMMNDAKSDLVIQVSVARKSSISHLCVLCGGN
jgi:hypothetical protein